MLDCIVCVSPEINALDQMGLRLLSEGMREFGYPIEGDEYSADRADWSKRVTTWTCSERDMPAVAEFLSKNYPGVDINVYKLHTVYYRVPGELQSKTVTKDGILPTL
jgi:hypothetical protein